MPTTGEGTAFLIVLIVLVVIGTVAICTVIDILRRPSSAFNATRFRKTTWVAIAIGLDVATFFVSYVGYLALGFLLYHWVWLRPRLGATGQS